MNILILCTKSPWPVKDGGSIATLNLAVGLAKSGCRITFLAMNTPKHALPEDQIPEFLREQLSIRTVDVDTRIRPLAALANLLFSSLPYTAQRFISHEFKRELAGCLKQKKYDIIQLEGPYLSWYIPYIRKISGASVSLRAHNMEHRIWEQMALGEKSGIRKRYMTNLSGRIRRLETGILRQIDLLVPISGTDEKDFLDLGAGIPVCVCPAGLDISQYPEKKQPDGIQLFYIGALDWAPNFQGLDWFFREIWPVIVNRWPDMTISIAGRNPSYFKSRRSLPENVSMEGEVEDSLDYFHRHNIMIVPLLSGSGIRVKILEAMALGKIVISTSIGASGLEASGGEHLFIADTAVEFMRYIQLIEENPSLLITMGTSARRLVMENFDNLAIAKSLHSFYKEHLR